MRKPVAAVQTQKDWTIVICDDGTAWLLIPEGKGNKADWTQVAPPLPGSPAAMKV